jgi:hypothetical protein
VSALSDNGRRLLRALFDGDHVTQFDAARLGIINHSAAVAEVEAAGIELERKDGVASAGFGPGVASVSLTLARDSRDTARALLQVGQELPVLGARVMKLLAVVADGHAINPAVAERLGLGCVNAGSGELEGAIAELTAAGLHFEHTYEAITSGTDLGRWPRFDIAAECLPRARALLVANTPTPAAA